VPRRLLSAALLSRLADSINFGVQFKKNTNTMVKRKAEELAAEEPGTSGGDDAPSNVVYIG
jgi:hypothetical protein